MIAYVVWASRDPWLTGTIASTYIAFIVGTAVVLDHHSVISSPVDYAVLGFRPVSSRTYFAVKLTNILVYTTALTTVAAWVPLLVALVRHGWGTQCRATAGHLCLVNGHDPGDRVGVRDGTPRRRSGRDRARPVVRAR